MIHMSSMRTKLIVAGLALAMAVGYLGFTSISQGWVYYMEVDPFLADQKYQSSRVRLHGTVAEDGLVIDQTAPAAEFALTGQTERLTVVYRGVIPEMFKAGGQVVVEGQLDQSGVFQADVLLTKCASKYQPQEPDLTMAEHAP